MLYRKVILVSESVSGKIMKMLIDRCMSGAPFVAGVNVTREREKDGDLFLMTLSFPDIEQYNLLLLWLFKPQTAHLLNFLQRD